MNFLARVYAYKDTAELVLRTSSVQESEDTMFGSYISMPIQYGRGDIISSLQRRRPHSALIAVAGMRLAPGPGVP
jgi:hypothetical protein